VDMMELMSYLETKLDPYAFAGLEEILLEDFPTCDMNDRIIQGNVNLEKYHSLRKKNLQVR
jgi:hypothetical protein